MAMAEIEKADTASSKEGGGWGTLEELLLACAVIRHGTESWDSVAMEVQKRANSGNKNTYKRNVDGGENIKSNLANSFTPQNCEQKYQALKRRFKLNGGGVEDEGGSERLSMMVDELRKLRVEELRRQLERHDVSIGSLQLKVKKLEDERGKSSSEAKEEVGGADLVAVVDRSNTDEREARGLEEVAEKSLFSERSDEPEDGSFNESNSTSQKGGGGVGGRGMREADAVPAEMAPEKDCSSSYDLEKGKGVGRTSPASRAGYSGGESVSESKREGKESEARQSSDVQSSVSLSRRKWRGWRRSDGLASSGDEIETEGWSPVNQKKDIKSQPLIKFFEIVRSHKHGSVFQRRLPSQETEKYSKLIRQHLDLEAVQSKLERGVYNECHSRFYRDLLVVFTNALLFFCKSSTENAAARDLRKLVTKEIIAQRAAPKPQAGPAPLKPDLESHIPDAVVKKPRSSTNIVVCRRRTNTNAAKPPSSSEKNAGKSKVAEEVKVESLDTKRKNNGGSDGSRKNNGKKDEEESSDEDEQPINQRRKVLASSRKQGVVNFLKRMQQNTEAGAKPSENEETTTKKVVGGKKKDGDEVGEAKRRISGRRSGKGEETEKRGGGRPPTRKATLGGTPDSGRLKRRREGDDKEPPGRSASTTTTTAAKKSRR